MTTEKLKFKVGLAGTFWDKRPAYSIHLNGQTLDEGTIAGNSGETEVKEFEVEVTEDTNNRFEIKLLNKTPTDTIENENKTAIVKDMLLNIVSIEIDDINLGPMLWSASKFYPEDSTRPIMDNCIDLGWNGSYTIEFSSPFYLWLLENM